MNQLRLPYLFIALFFLGGACTSIPGSDYYEAEGIISADAVNLARTGEWNVVHTPLFTAAESAVHDGTSAQTLELNVFVRRPGTYSLWLLVADGPDSSENGPVVRMFDEQRFLLESYRPELSHREVPVWTTRDRNSGDPLEFYLDQPGHYSLVIESDGQYSFKLSRVHLTLNNENPPWGAGYPETLTADDDPRLLKRDHRVNLPPAWGYGLMISGDDEQISALLNEELPVDAVWTSDPDLFRDREIRLGYVLGQGETPEEQVDFYVTSRTDSLSELNTLYSRSVDEGAGSRGFVMAPYAELDNPAIKQYPSPGKASFDNSERPFGQLQSQLERTANPRKMTYEIPFYRMAAGWEHPDWEGEVAEELFLRWIQLTSFSTVMAIPFPTGSDLHSSPRVVNTIRELAELRSRLFPFIYSYSLRARTGRGKILVGREDSPDQFLVGDEILVAPFLTENDSRSVYFPDGTWYDFFDRASYEGGQSWVVESSADRPLLFVRAGAIIPMREKASPVTQGSNDHLNVDIFTGDSGNFRLYEDDGLSDRYRRGEYTTIAFRYFEHSDYATFNIGAIVRDFPGQRSESSYTLRFRMMEKPESVAANETELEQGRESRQWHYDEEEETLIIRWDQTNDRRTEFHIDF